MVEGGDRMNESILADLKSVKEKLGELQRERDRQILSSGTWTRRSCLSDLLAATGEFLAEYLDDVWSALDQAEDEINDLRSELEGKNYELEMVKMELEVLKSA